MARRGGMQLDPNRLMRQMQKMQADVERIQDEVSQEIVTATAGGGAVEVSITGGLEFKAIKIDPEVVDAEDVEMLQDLILAAVNEAVQKAQAMMADRMAAVTGGLGGLPGL
ncbi:MAG: YbaB/EbfC family nucleoid-associated protein [Anaerolineae bacterium]|nr:YbaB/EbfC family nucleoid-associated protein [Anaerolineae bacterium]